MRARKPKHLALEAMLGATWLGLIGYSVWTGFRWKPDAWLAISVFLLLPAIGLAKRRERASRS